MIFDQLSLEDQRLLTYFAGKSYQTPLEYLELRLKKIAARRKYCEQEGLNYYKDFFWRDFLENIHALQKGYYSLRRVIKKTSAIIFQSNRTNKPIGDKNVKKH